MQVTTRNERLELGSALRPAIPLYLALVVGSAMALATGTTLLRLVALGVIASAFLAIDFGTLKRVLLTIVVIEIPLQLDFFLNHDRTAPLTDANGFNVSVTTLCLVALYTIWLAELAAGKDRARMRIVPTVMPALAFTAASVLSLVAADVALFAAYEIAVVVQGLLILVYVTSAIRTRQDMLLVVVLLLIGLTLQGVIAVAQQAFGVAFELGPIRTDAALDRVAGTLRHPNRLGAFAAFTLGPALGLAMARPVPRGYRVFAGVSFGFGVLALFGSQSRGAILGVFLALTMAVVVAYRRRWLKPRAVIVGGLVVVVVVVTQFGALAERLQGFDDPNVVGRLRLMEVAFLLIRENPVFGVGANHFFYSLPDVVTVDFSGAWLATVHNKYLLVWVETGLLGILAFSYFLLAVVHRAWRVYRSGDPFLSPVALGFVAGLIAVMVHMNFDKFASRVDVHLLWLIAGIVFAMDRIGHRPLGR